MIKSISGMFTVESEGKTYLCSGRGKIKKYLEEEICAGDYVDFSRLADGGVIERVAERRNFLIRPPVANVDQIVIVIACVPIPDFILVDKILIHAERERIPVVLCVNKIDMNDEEFNRGVTEDYAGVADRLIFLSAKNGKGIGELREALGNRLSCLVGQSAVGKSSIANELFGSLVAEVGEISLRSGRGKHTTRSCELNRLPQGGFLVDTPGFTFLDVFDRMDPANLAGVYIDFNAFAEECKFRGCRHLNEPGCAVKRAVEAGKLSRRRYDRYCGIHEECKKRWDNRY